MMWLAHIHWGNKDSCHGWWTAKGSPDIFAQSVTVLMGILHKLKGGPPSNLSETTCTNIMLGGLVGQCTNKIISTTCSNGTCPSCRPYQRAETRNDPSDVPQVANLRSLDDICTTRARLVKYVPRGARAAWGQALSQFTARVVFHNSVEAWTELACHVA